MQSNHLKFYIRYIAYCLSYKHCKLKKENTRCHPIHFLINEVEIGAEGKPKCDIIKIIIRSRR